MIVYGDVHGKVKEFQQLIQNHSSKTPIIQVGDMGCGFGYIPHFPPNVRFIRGNHDDPAAARMHPNYMGNKFSQGQDYGYDPELKMFWVAGAWSIDYGWRQLWNLQNAPRKVWWEDKELSQNELDMALELYKEFKPEIMITHEAPASIVPHVLIKSGLIFKEGDLLYNDKFVRQEKLECIKTRTSTALQNMLDAHRPVWWIFGHFHVSKLIDTGSTLFKCVAELEPFHIPGT